MRRLTLPLSEADVRSLHVGDPILLSGVMLTGRDTAHTYFLEQLAKDPLPEGEAEVAAAVKPLLRGGAIYHCGPVVKKVDGGHVFVAAGPTTSIREEPYEADVIKQFGLRVVIGKGGMGRKTLAACQEFGAIYLHAIGGAATLIAKTVKQVEGVYKLEFGVPEALWRIRVVDFPGVVTMDSHGQSIHEKVEADSRMVLQRLMKA
jgi:fumarate hydratase class I